MSLLVHYTLKSADDHEAQKTAMTELGSGLRAEGITGLNYACFATDDPLRFVGVLEFLDDATKQAFLASRVFAKYRDVVGPIFAKPPETTQITLIASTRG